MNKDKRTEPMSTRTERPMENPDPWLERYSNHKCYITFLTGCYSCQWQYSEWERTELGSCCCTWREQFFHLCLVISFILSVIFLFVWSETSNEYNSFDWVVYLGTGRWFFWSIIMLSTAGILTAYTSLLLVLVFLLLWERIELYMHTCHKVIIVLAILLCSFLIAVLSKFWKDKWLIAGLSLQIYAPFVHLILITVMIIISWPLAICFAHLESEALQMAAALPFLIILICLYLMPLGIYSPCIQDKKDLGPKPGFFGHRGAPMLAPENTMMSFEKAVEHDAFGLETDVYLSYPWSSVVRKYIIWKIPEINNFYDRVPFLMHDYDLSRTTNIREVLPDSTYNHTAWFNWTFLSTLNAGKWFLENKPFLNMEPLSEADKKKASNQKIPQLADLLKLAKKKQKFVIFDLFGPPPKHPLRHSFVRRVIRVILDSKIEQHLIFWLPTPDRDYVKIMAPGFQHVGRLLSIDRLRKENISIINVDYKRLFYSGLRDYKAANIYINLYLVNEPWLFSLAWCSRINSVTTDNIALLKQIKHPLFYMTPKRYLCVWLFMVVCSAFIICVIFYYHCLQLLLYFSLLPNTFSKQKELKKEKWLEAASATADVQETT